MSIDVRAFKEKWLADMLARKGNYDNFNFDTFPLSDLFILQNFIYVNLEAHKRGRHAEKRYGYYGVSRAITKRAQANADYYRSRHQRLPK